MSKPKLQPILELILSLLDAPYTQPEKRHCFVLERDVSCCFCVTPRETEVTMQHFTELVTNLLTRHYSMPHDQLVAYIFGPVRHSTSTTPTFDFLAYSGSPSAPRPSPAKAIRADTALRNILGTDGERMIPSKQAERLLPDAPYLPTPLDTRWDSHGSAYYVGTDKSGLVRQLVSPAHYAFGLESHGFLFSDYLDEGDLFALCEVLKNRFDRFVTKHTTCCQQYEPTAEDNESA